MERTTAHGRMRRADKWNDQKCLFLDFMIAGDPCDKLLLVLLCNEEILLCNRFQTPLKTEL